MVTRLCIRSVICVIVLSGSFIAAGEDIGDVDLTNSARAGMLLGTIFKDGVVTPTEAIQLEQAAFSGLLLSALKFPFTAVGAALDALLYASAAAAGKVGSGLFYAGTLSGVYIVENTNKHPYITGTITLAALVYFLRYTKTGQALTKSVFNSTEEEELYYQDYCACDACCNEFALYL